MGDLLGLLGVGAVAGAVGALLGVGGGVILVPALTLLLGFPLRAAVGVSLVCVVAMSVASSAVYLRRGSVELLTALELQFYAVLGAVCAGLVAVRVPAGPLFLAFGLLLAFTASRAWPSRQSSPRAAHSDPAHVFRLRRGVAAGASVGTGALSGFLGVGGGMLYTPVLHVILGIQFDRAVATSAYMIGVTAAAAALVYLARGDVDLMVAGPTMLGTLVGAALGAFGAPMIKPAALKLAFVILLVYAAIQMTVRGIATL